MLLKDKNEKVNCLPYITNHRTYLSPRDKTRTKEAEICTSINVQDSNPDMRKYFRIRTKYSDSLDPNTSHWLARSKPNYSRAYE